MRPRKKHQLKGAALARRHAVLVRDEVVTFERAVDLVAGFYRITPQELIGGGRRLRFSWPRTVAMHLVGRAGLPAHRVAELFGKDVSTVNLALRAVRELRRVDEVLESEIQQLEVAHD